jgi:hypothetical protein
MARSTATACLVMVCLSGCVGRQETRYLSLYPRRADVEARSWDFHDPFPDERIGPDTHTRPRQFVEPRTDTRKNYDQRFLQSVHPTAGTRLAPGPQYQGYGSGIVRAGGTPQQYAPGPVASSPYPYAVRPE